MTFFDEKINNEKLEKRIKLAAYTIVAIVAVVFLFFAVIRGVFGGTVWDKATYVLASVLFVVLLWYGIRQLSFLWLFRQLLDPENRGDFVQVGCYALICLMTLYYYNSGSEYGHAVGTRVINIAFAVAILCLYRREEWKRFLNVAVLAAVIEFFAAAFLTEHGTIEGFPGGLLSLLSAATAGIYTVLLLCLTVRAFRGELRRDFSRYALIVAAFFGLILIFRNTRYWPFSVVIPFGTLYLHRLDRAGEDRLLRNFSYGVILAFWLMFGAATLFRPYYSFEFTRYPSWFSSVASAGLFWMLVFGCTLSALLAKFQKCGKVSYVYFELLTLGCVTSHVFMSMSRTSLLAIGAFCLVAFVLIEAVQYRDNIRKMAYKALLVILPLFLAFPVVYTVTRCMPAVVARPIKVTGPEFFSDMIQKHEPMDSTKYMNIAQYGELFLEKLVGIDINLTSITGAVSGPGDRTTDESGEAVFDENVVATEERDGQVYTVKDYTFSNPDEGDPTNGRFDLFQIYAKHLNLTGHDTMIVEDAETNTTMFHAHNTYMQVAYDHGIIAGIVFIILLFGAFIYGVAYYKNNYSQVSFAILPVIVVISFMIAGVTEWIFHPSIPIGFALLFILAPLMSRSEKHAES